VEPGNGPQRQPHYKRRIGGETKMGNLVSRIAEARRKKRARTESRKLPEFMAGDIILCASKGDWYGEHGGWFMQGPGEGPTYAVHAAQFVDGQTVLEMRHSATREPVGKILKINRGLEVWRCKWLTEEQREALTAEAMTYLNTKFGTAKIFTHFLDGLVNKVTGRELFFFRRLNYRDRYPLCSWITAFSYDKALNYRFGVPPDCADPDHIHDWVKSHPEEWELVFRLKELSWRAAGREARSPAYANR
jgi:hypothetical protein